MITNKWNPEGKEPAQTSITKKTNSCAGLRCGIVGGALLLLFSFLFTGCYHKKTPSSFRLPDSIQEAQISRRIEAEGDSILKDNDSDDIEWSGTRSKVDSLAFRVKHHYSQGFNFIVTDETHESSQRHSLPLQSAPKLSPACQWEEYEYQPQQLPFRSSQRRNLFPSCLQPLLVVDEEASMNLPLQ